MTLIDTISEDIQMVYCSAHIIYFLFSRIFFFLFQIQISACVARAAGINDICGALTGTFVRFDALRTVSVNLAVFSNGRGRF